MKHTFSLFFMLAAVWLAWSGIYDNSLLFALGLVSVVGVVILTRRMGAVDSESAPYDITLRSMLYAPWLGKEIILANLDIARRILSPGMPIAPRMIKVRGTQTTDLTRVIYANSITLTPGTVSVDLEGSEITVHALTAEAADALERGEMDRRVTGIEGGAR